MALLQSLLIATCFLQTWAQDSVENVGVIGGHNAFIQNAPFIAGILKDGKIACVGSIIHKSFILTSASCSFQGQRQVLVGTARLNRGGKLYRVEEAICHGQYDANTGLNDICLLKLKKKLQFGRKIARIRLPERNENILNGTLFNITGWGSVDSQGTRYPDRLKQATVSAITNKSCKSVYGNVVDSMVCTFSPGQGGCFGDTGAPLTKNNVQYGLFSRINSKDCGIKPSIYTRLTAYLDWIHFMITTYNDSILN